MKNRYIYALFSGDARYAAAGLSTLFGALALGTWWFNVLPGYGEKLLFTGLVLLLAGFVTGAVAFIEGLKFFDKKIAESVSSWVNSANTEEERVRRWGILQNGGQSAALAAMHNEGFRPAVNVGGTLMANNDFDIHGNPYGYDPGPGDTHVTGMHLDPSSAYQAPIGMDSTTFDRH